MMSTQGSEKSASTESADFVDAAIRIISTTIGIDEIEAALGASASRTAVREADSPNGSREVRWILDSALPDSAELEKHISGLLEILEDRRSVLQSIQSAIEIDIWCTVSTESGFAGIVLPETLIERCAQAKATIVLSVYAK